MSVHIEAVSVNHNTSAYMELMLRSFLAYSPAPLSYSLTLFDNASNDDTSALDALAHQHRVSLIQSGWGLETKGNSHGDILRQFVLTYPGCSHYLFLDADVVFLAPQTIQTMLVELEHDAMAFGIGARMSWDGVSEIPKAIRESNPDICDARLHPCCALVKNTPLFRTVVDVIGLACATLHGADRDEFLDTFKLMTRVMQTHGLRHTLSSMMVQHFFCVSYDWDTAEVRLAKAQTRDRLLAKFRADEAERPS